MNDYGIIGKVLADFGMTGLLVAVAYKLLDKWAGKFLTAQTAQAAAMTSLAEAVKGSMTDQRDLLLSVRVLAAKQEDTVRWIQEVVQGAAQGRLFNGGHS